MTSAEALLDSNVLIAVADDEHTHYGPSVALFESSTPKRFAVSAHSLAETYSTLTRRRAGAGFGWPPADARIVVESIAADTVLLGLTPGQTLETVYAYAQSGGVGPRLYDRLIGEAAVRAGLRRIVTWNAKHMRGLFPSLDVLTPEEFLSA
jgi:predicted nucleic acid-binding protein